MISCFCLSMIFSENRFPLSRIMLQCPERVAHPVSAPVIGHQGRPVLQPRIPRKFTAFYPFCPSFPAWDAEAALPTDWLSEEEDGGSRWECLGVSGRNR